MAPHTISLWEKGKLNLTLCQLKTPEPIITKFGCRDNVVDTYYQKLGLIRRRVFAPHIG